MVSQEEIQFNTELHENSSIEDVIRLHPNDVLIFVHGSGGNRQTGAKPSYQALLEYKGRKKYISAVLSNETPNQVCIKGIMDCLENIVKPSRICVITAASLGFVTGFKGKGPNGKLIQSLYEALLEKGCTLTESKCDGLADQIKRYIRENSGDTKIIAQSEVEKKAKEHYASQYANKIYSLCKKDVIEVLKAENISDAVIDKIKQLELKQAQ